MEDFVTGTLPNCTFSSSQVLGMDYWERTMLYDMDLMVLKPTNEEFEGD
jgi:hypothetical protein